MPENPPKDPALASLPEEASTQEAAASATSADAPAVAPATDAAAAPPASAAVRTPYLYAVPPASPDPSSPATAAPVSYAPPKYRGWVALSLAAANIAVWLVTVALGASVIDPSPERLFELGGNLGMVTLQGEEWRLFTAMFLHSGVLHLGMNMLGLVLGGQVVERLFGRAGFAAIYLIAGLAGSLTTALRPGVVSVGASGAIFGVLGALGGYYLVHRDRMEPRALRDASGLLAVVGYNVVFGFAQPGIDMYAHLGGLAAGFLCGLALEIGRREPRLPRVGAVAVVGLAAVIAGAFAAPAPEGVNPGAMSALVDAQQQVLRRWNVNIVPEIQAERMSDDEVAGVIERDILPPWRAAREAFARDGGRGARYTAVLEYMEVRQEAWELLAAAARTQDQAKAERAGRGARPEAERVTAR